MIDTDKLLTDAGSFSIMNRYMEYNNQFTKQPYVFKGTFSFELNMPYDETVRELMPIKGSGTFEGISEQDKQNMSMAMQLDTEALKKYISTEAPDEETAEIANSVVSALEDVKINYRYFYWKNVFTMHNVCACRHGRRCLVLHGFE